MCCHIDFGNIARRPSCVTTGLRPSNHPTSTAYLGPCHWDSSLNRCPELHSQPLLNDRVLHAIFKGEATHPLKSGRSHTINQQIHFHPHHNLSISQSTVAEILKLFRPEAS